MKWLCFHKWNYVAAVYDDDVQINLAAPAKPATRTCTKCGRTDEQHIHLLGLNPRSTYSYWETK